MEFVLDQSFDEIFAVNQTSKPLEVLKLLQFSPKVSVSSVCSSMRQTQ